MSLERYAVRPVCHSARPGRAEDHASWRATLSIDPLAVLVQGTFDEQGSFSIDISKELDALKQPIVVLAQAIAMARIPEAFMTSNVVGIGIITSGSEVAPAPLDPLPLPVPAEGDAPPVNKV